MRTLSEAVRAEGYAFFTGPLDELRAAGWEPVRVYGANQALLLRCTAQNPQFRFAFACPSDSWAWAHYVAQGMAELDARDYDLPQPNWSRQTHLLAKWLKAVTQ